MPLTGQAKTDYQREYMRKRRSNKMSNIELESVRPKVESVRPAGISNNQWAYIQSKAEELKRNDNRQY